MKLFHDDIRRPPDNSWVWARTNEDAKSVLLAYEVETISLDHDLGLDGLDPDLPDAIYLRGQGEQTGLDLVDWMLANDCVPPHVTVHSMNAPAADRMVKALQARGHVAYRVPYQAPYR